VNYANWATPCRRGLARHVGLAIKTLGAFETDGDGGASSRITSPHGKIVSVLDKLIIPRLPPLMLNVVKRLGNATTVAAVPLTRDGVQATRAY
jgi:hypothetical protein